MTVTTDRVPVGEIRIKDPNPINWLYITWNTHEEIRETA